MGSRQCPFCGSLVDADALSCYHCREAIPAQVSRVRDPAAGYHEIRRGVLYMILSGVIHYAAANLADYSLPIEVPPVLTDYLTPLLFLGGLGFFLYGWILKLRG